MINVFKEELKKNSFKIWEKDKQKMDEINKSLNKCQLS